MNFLVLKYLYEILRKAKLKLFFNTFMKSMQYQLQYITNVNTYPISCCLSRPCLKKMQVIIVLQKKTTPINFCVIRQ